MLSQTRPGLHFGSILSGTLNINTNASSHLKLSVVWRLSFYLHCHEQYHIFVLSGPYVPIKRKMSLFCSSDKSQAFGTLAHCLVHAKN